MTVHGYEALSQTPDVNLTHHQTTEGNDVHGFS